MKIRMFGLPLEPQIPEKGLYKDRESRIAAIEKTFEDSKKTITRHYRKPGVTPVEVLPVFPDFKNWINPCAHVMFDPKPLVENVNKSTLTQMMSQAIIRSMTDKEGKQVVGHFLPREKTMQKRKRDQDEGLDYTPDEKYEYDLAGQYSWKVEHKGMEGFQTNYLLNFRDGDGIYYNELDFRLRLRKKRVTIEDGAEAKTVLAVKHREPNEKELEYQEFYKDQLKNPEPEEEEE